MANVLITYDIRQTTTTIHTIVKNAMIAKGYSDELKAGSNNVIYKLPNTSLSKIGITAVQASNDLEAVCNSNQAVLEKYFSVEFDNYRIKSDVTRQG